MFHSTLLLLKMKMSHTQHIVTQPFILKCGEEEQFSEQRQLAPSLMHCLVPWYPFGGQREDSHSCPLLFRHIQKHSSPPLPSYTYKWMNIINLCLNAPICFLFLPSAPQACMKNLNYIKEMNQSNKETSIFINKLLFLKSGKFWVFMNLFWRRKKNVHNHRQVS